MKIRGLVALVVMGGAVATAPAKNKKDAQLPPLFCQAHNVYVQTANGDPQQPGVLPGDRAAAIALILQLQAWKRYTLVTDPQQADLVWVVRTGRAAPPGTGNSGGGLGANGSPVNQDPSGTITNPGGPNMSRGGPAQNSPGGPGQGGLSGPGGMGSGDSMGAGPSSSRGATGSDDVLAVFQRPNGGPLSSPLWQKNEYNGLQGPKLPLFERIRTAVDASCAAAAAQPAAPAQ
jgi:hypothetical protein